MGRGAFTNLTAEEFIDRTAISQLIGWIPSSIFYVDSVNGSNNNDGFLRSSAKATIAGALSLCTAGKGDAICVLPGHTETLSATTQGIAFSKSGVALVGFGNGRNRPAITCGAADIVGFLLSGANCLVQNLRFIGSTSQTTKTSTIMSITAADCTVRKCVFEHGGAGPLDAVSVTAASRLLFEDNVFIGTSAGPDCGIKIFTGLKDAIVRSNQFLYATSAGLDSGGIMGSASADTAGTIFHDNHFVGMDLTAIDINGSVVATTCESIISHNYAAFRSGVTITACIDAGGAALMDNFVTDATAAAPVWTVSVDTAASNFPTGTPA